MCVATPNRSLEPTRAYRRSLYRGFLALLVDLFSIVILPTRRGGSIRCR
jgi:hypothetical protein